MSDEQMNPDERRVVESLADPRALRETGVSEDWIKQCEELVTEYRRLQQQFQELEKRLSGSEGQSPQDTVVF